MDWKGTEESYDEEEEAELKIHTAPIMHKMERKIKKNAIRIIKITLA
jgi:hypothetical protein